MHGVVVNTDPQNKLRREGFVYAGVPNKLEQEEKKEFVFKGMVRGGLY